MRQPGQPYVIGIFGADLHLSHNPPAYRSGEKSWYGAQMRVLAQLEHLKYQNNNCPLILAGDIFHKWNSPAELINLALDYLPSCYAVPGQHDLPYHDYEEQDKSAYGTLKRAGKLIDLQEQPVTVGEMRLHGFPWGIPVKPLEQPHDLLIEVAVIHDYIWADEHTGFPGAPKDKLATKLRKRLVGYDLAFSGDNHKSFQRKLGDCLLTNCGSLMRRNSDQAGDIPYCYLVYSNGSVEWQRLDTSKDVYLDVGNQEQVAQAMDLELDEFLADLGGLGQAAVDFQAAVEQALRLGKVGEKVRRVVLRALEAKG